MCCIFKKVANLLNVLSTDKYLSSTSVCFFLMKGMGQEES